MCNKILWAFAALIVFVQASGEFAVLHTPDSVIFKGNKEIDQSLLKEVFSASLGFTVKQRAIWNGLLIKNPFNLPEAVVAIAVEGVDSLGVIKGKKFPLNVDEVEETTWQALSGRIGERDNDNSLVRIYLGDGLDALGQSALGELKPTSIDESSLKALSLKNEEDRKFLDEVQLLRAIAKKVPSAINADNKSDVYWLVVSGLRPVFDVHGKNSVAAKEALTLLNEALHEVSKAFMDAYDGHVLIAAFTNDASQVRHTRSTQLRYRRDVENNKELEKSDNEYEKQTENKNEDSTHENSEKINDRINTDTHAMKISSSYDETVHNDSNDFKHNQNELLKPNAIQYSEDYPVIFNILLWFGVAFFFSLLAICITIAEMDPGRDSIIYRMTSNRMKKDN